MERRNNSPWGNCPYYLDFEDVQNPVAFLGSFFGDFPENHRKELEAFRDAACSSKVYKNKKMGSGSLVFICRQNIRLLECCYLLFISYRNLWGNCNKMNPELVGEGKNKWAWYPEDLTENQQWNPYRVLIKVFKAGSLEQYRRDLEEWLYFALLKDQVDTAELNLSIATVYESLTKLYSATWLIWQSESGKPFLKSELIAN